MSCVVLDPGLGRRQLEFLQHWPLSAGYWTCSEATEKSFDESHRMSPTEGATQSRFDRTDALTSALDLWKRIN